MKTRFDDAIAKLVDIAREGFSRGWDRLDRADRHDAIANAICGVHAEWFQLVEERNALRAEVADWRRVAKKVVLERMSKIMHARETAAMVELQKMVTRGREQVFADDQDSCAEHKAGTP